MSNRQARRDQVRQRSNRPAPGTRAASGSRKPSSGGGGGNGVMSGPFMLIVGAVVVALGIVLAIVILTGGSGGTSSEQVDKLDQASANLPLDLVDGAKVGSEDAPVKVTVFEDFQCRFCLDFTADQEGEVIEQFVKSGELQLEYRHLPLQGAESFAAALASQCAADQNMFWQYHNRLFRIQAENNHSTAPRANVGRFTTESLKDIAADLGLDTAEFNSCFDNQDHLDTITDHERTARSFGISGTPGFLVNGQPLGTGAPTSIDAWRDLIDEVVGISATATAGAGSPTADASASPEATATPTP